MIHSFIHKIKLHNESIHIVLHIESQSYNIIIMLSFQLNSCSFKNILQEVCSGGRAIAKMILYNSDGTDRLAYPPYHLHAS